MKKFNLPDFLRFSKCYSKACLMISDDDDNDMMLDDCFCAD